MTALCIVVFSLLSAGCGKATYKNENLESSLIKICKDEYKTDVKVKRAGRTIGVYVPVNGLFETNVDLKNQATLEDVLSGIKFTKDAMQKLEDVSLVITRVALSTDAPVDFYILIATDVKGSGIQIVITRYVNDMKRLMLGDLSHGDYSQRLLMDMGFDPAPSAEETIKSFFYDLQRFSPQVVASRYFSKTTNIRILSSDFFLYLAESDYKQARKYFITDLNAAQIEKGKVLIKCKVRETYQPAPGYENFKFLYPSGFENEYLILLSTAYIPYMIEQITPVYFVNKSGNTEKISYPESLVKYKNPQLFDKNNFFLEEVQLPNFLVQQIAGKIRFLYQSDQKLKDKFIVSLIKGEYHPVEKKFSIVFDVEEKKRSPSAKGVDFNGMWNIVSETLRRYEFNDYKSVELFNIADTKKETIMEQ